MPSGLEGPGHLVGRGLESGEGERAARQADRASGRAPPPPRWRTCRRSAGRPLCIVTSHFTVLAHVRTLILEWEAGRQREPLPVHPGTRSPMSPLTETLARRAVETFGGRPAGRVHPGDAPHRRGHLRPHRADRQPRSVVAGHPGPHRPLHPGLLPAVPLEGRADPGAAGRRAAHAWSTTSSTRMATEPTPAARVRAWIEGVLAQASTRRSADRTRPFLANEDRLSELFPDEQRESVDLLVGLLAEPLAALAPAGTPERDDRRRRRGHLPTGVRTAPCPPDPAHPAVARRRSLTPCPVLPARRRAWPRRPS